ncbi:hypothetical protein Tco_0569139 [Tanacetum coccineum]
MRDFMYIKVWQWQTTKFWGRYLDWRKPLKLYFPVFNALDNIKRCVNCMKLNEPYLLLTFRLASIRGGIEQSQFKELTDLLIPIVLNPCPDRWFWSLEGSGEFSVASIRRFIDDQVDVFMKEVAVINPDSVDKNDPKDVQLEDEDFMYDIALSVEPLDYDWKYEKLEKEVHGTIGIKLNDDDVIVVLHEDAQATFGDTNDPFTFISMSKDLADKRIKILQLMTHINS